MSIISRTTYTVTVMHRTDEQPADLHDAIEEAEGGHAVGGSEAAVTVPVADEDVRRKLIELGNDGSFFDDDLEGGS